MMNAESLLQAAFALVAESRQLVAATAAEVERLHALVKAVEEQVDLRQEQAEIRLRLVERRRIRAQPVDPSVVPLREIVGFSASEILRAVVRAFGFDHKKIKSPHRATPLVEARYAVTLLMREFGYSYPSIGTVLKRDHSTIMAAQRRGDAMMQADPAFAKRVQSARAKLMAMEVADADPVG